MKKNKRRMGDRKDGRLIRSLSALPKMIPYIMPTRNDAHVFYEESFEVTALERRLRQLRSEGSKGLGILHFIIAAYIRAVSMLPGVNRFVVGRRIYAANDISVNMMVKRGMSVDASETAIKVHFEPTDTIHEVYSKMSTAIEDVKANEENNNTESVADALAKAPRGILRFAVLLIRIFDYFGWLPESLVEASPFHGSMIITDLGSLRIGPVYHHIYNIGTLPVFIAFGAKRKVIEFDKTGTPVERKYIDMKFTLDERTVDGHYYAQFLQALRYLFQHPEVVEAPPTEVVEDIY